MCHTRNINGVRLDGVEIYKSKERVSRFEVTHTQVYHVTYYNFVQYHIKHFYPCQVLFSDMDVKFQWFNSFLRFLVRNDQNL